MSCVKGSVIYAAGLQDDGFTKGLGKFLSIQIPHEGANGLWRSEAHFAVYRDPIPFAFVAFLKHHNR